LRSQVYFIPVDNKDNLKSIAEKLKILLKASCLFDFLRKDYKVAVKMHFGEDGNTGFVRPEYLRIICDRISDKGATALLADTNTLYRGRRTNSKEHLAIARQHGFTKEATGAEVVVPVKCEPTTSPTTDNLAYGVVVPMPTLPLSSILILSFVCPPV